MDPVSLAVAIVSLAVASASLGNWVRARGRQNEHSVLTYEALLQVRRLIDRLDQGVLDPVASSGTQQELKKMLLTNRNDLERRVRRLILFTKDAPLVAASLLWFMENAIPEDRGYIVRALELKCIIGRENRRCAQAIIQRLT